MLATYRKLFDLLNPHERRRFYLLLGLIILMALVDTIGVASIMPFLAVVANPAAGCGTQEVIGMHEIEQVLAEAMQRVVLAMRASSWSTITVSSTASSDT